MTVVTCPSCGADSPAHFKFCGQCAAELAAPRPARDERRTVTTLFCDLVGFTSMSEAADPEEIDALLRSYFARATRVIGEHGGVVEKFIGDAVVGVFGVPVVHEDDPERAVRAGLDLLTAFDGLTRPDGAPLEARVGVNTGLAVVRLDVAPGSGEGFLTGDAVNTAARLQAAAPPMSVVVGQLTHGLTAAAFSYSAVEPLSLKGKADRVPAWLAVEAAPEGGSPLRSGAPMVGRQRESAAGVDAILRLREGTGGLLLITGEAGIGKTRLVEELHGSADREGCAWLEGRTLSFGRSISYWPFLEIVQQDAGIASDDGEAERAAKLGARLTALFGGEVHEVLPYIASLLSLPVPEELSDKVRHLDGEAMGRQLYRAMRLYLARLSEERPLVVAFEDVHWLDASSAALLEHLLPLMNESAILFCCVSRPEPESPLSRLEELARADYALRATPLALRALSSADSSELIHHLTGVDRLPGSLRDAILEKAQGNPFFVEEIVRSLIDLGGLERVAAGAYRVTSGAERIAIPDTLLGVIMARVDRLDEDLKQVLRLASVIGRTFFYRLLAALDDADRDLDGSLAALQERELVLERARDPELEYMFKHALVQEATYESILLQRRRELHRRVAGAIETLLVAQLDELSSLLAYHYSKAEDWEKATHYLLKAGDQAGSIAADAEALAHYQDAIDAYARAFGDTWDPVQRAALQRKMGEALYHRGEHALAAEYLLRALATLGSPFPASPAAVRWALLLQVLVQTVHRLLPWFRGRTLSPQAVRVAEERCHAYDVLVWTNAMAQAGVWLLAVMLCLNLGERARLDWAASSGASGVAMALQTLASTRLYGVYMRRARSLAERGGNDHELAQATFVGAMHTFWVAGDLPSTVAESQAASSLYLKMGDVRGWTLASALGITVPAERGRWADALASSREIARLGEETGDHLAHVAGQAWEAELLYLAGELETGEEGMRRAVDAMAEMMDFRVGAKVAGRLGVCLLAQGRVQEAQALLDEQLDRIQRYGIVGGLISSVIIARAEVALVVAERAEEATRSVALKELGKACRALRKQARADKTASVPAARLQGTCQWLRGRTRRAQTCWTKSLQAAEQLGCRYQGALTTLEMGHRLGDRGHLEHAGAEFAAMGAGFWLAQTRELLSQRPG